LSFQRLEINEHFWGEKIHQAIERRKRLGLINNQGTNAFRLIHGEGDDLPGLIADYYNGLVVMQCHSAGMYLNKEMIAHILKNELHGIKAVYNKSKATLPPRFQNFNEDGFILGECPSPVEILENKLHFLVDFKQGQKTGFFLDQRENRKLLSLFCKDKSVANLYGYTGGFSVYAAMAGARQVITVDSSEPALKLAEKNYLLNGVENKVENYQLEIKDFFKNNSRMYDVIILDPPAFAKHIKHRKNAMIHYKNINAAAIKILNKGGVLFSFSCSQAISAAELRQAIFVAAANSGRRVAILHQLFQPPDHPVNIFHPEGEYLKGFVLMVD
ncbi:MAG: class I SAM-dependent rRNA methyltransferase, partial [Bacteroidetes bacterium]